ncbi:hypothetical protein FKM82_020050, partial [Ascaphus truei]
RGCTPSLSCLRGGGEGAGIHTAAIVRCCSTWGAARCEPGRGSQAPRAGGCLIAEGAPPVSPAWSQTSLLGSSLMVSPPPTSPIPAVTWFLSLSATGSGCVCELLGQSLSV